MRQLAKYSFGVGDRFAHQGAAQLQAVMDAERRGVQITPVWNKSFREHSIIHTTPASTRIAADSAVQEKGWRHEYFVDADHINLSNLEQFLDAGDFFTIDVAEAIGTAPAQAEFDEFVSRNLSLLGRQRIAGIHTPLELDRAGLEAIGATYLHAVKQAAETYRAILKHKQAGDFITEVSMDETNQAQSPLELLVILKCLADEGVPVATIAPKFTGRFNKGVDYVGDIHQFATEFSDDVAVLRFAVQSFGLPQNLKLSVHSGSDKFAIYPIIRRVIREADTGVHVKTAGTTWLAELEGLALSGPGGLEIAREVYSRAFERREELCEPYAAVINIDPQRLPPPETLRGWDGAAFVRAVRHDQTCADYNPSIRQLLHVGYKIAAEMGPEFTGALERNARIVGREVSANIFDRHLCPLFLDG